MNQKLFKSQSPNNYWFKIIKFWLPVVIWATVIFVFSAHPVSKATEVYWQDFVIKKIAHLVEYAILSLLLYRALVNEGMNKKEAGISAVILCFLYGLSDELHQSFTPGREPKIRDVIFDTIGATLAIYGIWKYLPKAPEKLKNWAKRLQIS